MDDLDLIIDLHVRNHRQGPGSDVETRRAIEMARIDQERQITIADIGSGTGAASLVLANTLNAHITAVDFAKPFIDALSERAAEAGLSDRIEASIGQMESLPFRDEQFDVLWSEGAIYNMGFTEGLRAWRRFLRPGGIIAVSEITWTTSQRPAALEEYWNAEYPGIATASEKLRVIEEEGYGPLGFFFLPRDCWEEHFYGPLRSSFSAFMERHDNSDASRAIVDAEEKEIDLYREFGQYYCYGFYVARKL
jgi:SAM-dependent methyltransferase